MSNEKIHFVHYDRVFLEKSWEWLNDPEIKLLTNTPDFSREQQEKFYESFPRNDYKIWGMKYEGRPIGVVGLKNINDNEAEYFGYIGDKNFWGKGLFTVIIRFILDQAVDSKINCLTLKVDKNNLRAIKAYRREGFKIIKSDSYFYFMNMDAKNNAHY